jgi:hypothetical protein
MEKPMTKERVRRPVRFNRARSDGSVGALKRRITNDYGLPEGSILIVGPDGRAIRTDARIGTVRKRYA